VEAGHIDEIRRFPRTLAFGTFLFLAMCCFGAALWIWDGRKSRELTFEQLLRIVESQRHPDAAIERLRAKTQESIRAIRRHRENSERTGALARNALEHISNEVAK